MANNLLPLKTFLGTGVSCIINVSLSGDEDVHLFRKNVEKAYASYGKHLQKKMPLRNPFLIDASAIDPASREHSASLEQLLRLPRLVRLAASRRM